MPRLLDCSSPVCLLRRRHTGWRRLHNNAPLSTILHLLAVHTGCKTTVVSAGADLVPPLVVDVFDVEGVDVTGKVAVNM